MIHGKNACFKTSTSKFRYERLEICPFPIDFPAIESFSFPIRVKEDIKTSDGVLLYGNRTKNKGQKQCSIPTIAKGQRERDLVKSKNTGCEQSLSP